MSFWDFDGDFEWVRFPEEQEDGSFDDRFSYEDVKYMMERADFLFTKAECQEYLAKLETERERRKDDGT